jgi:hypothetical protein
MAAAAVTAAKVASLGGFTAFGVKKLLSTSRSEATVTTPETTGAPHEPAEDRISR